MSEKKIFITCVYILQIEKIFINLIYMEIQPKFYQWLCDNMQSWVIKDKWKQQWQCQRTRQINTRPLCQTLRMNLNLKVSHTVKMFVEKSNCTLFVSRKQKFHAWGGNPVPAAQAGQARQRDPQAGEGAPQTQGERLDNLYVWLMVTKRQSYRNGMIPNAAIMVFY